MRRSLALGVLLALACAGAASGAAPEGPRIAFVDWNESTRGFTLVTTDQTGHSLRRVAGRRFPTRVIEEAPFAYRPGRILGIMPLPAAPAWSPDGQQLLFSGWLVKPGRRWRFNWPSRNFLAQAAGGTPRVVRGLNDAAYPLFTPDGSEIVFARGRRAAGHPHAHHGEYSLWRGRPDGTERQIVSDWRYGVVDIPSSISPDGSAVAVTEVDERDESADARLAAFAVFLDGREKALIAAEAVGPVYSPDGARVAFTGVIDRSAFRSSSAIFVAAADGSSPVRLTRGDEIEDASPSWDPSGARIAFTREDRSGRGARKPSIEQVNADGSCEQTLFRERGAVLLAAPSWQPGPGRGAGPIAC